MPTTLWTSAVAKDLYVRELGNVTSGPIVGVMSCDALDVSNYDNTNYRDDFFDPKSTPNLIEDNMGGNLSAEGYVTKTTEAGVDTVASIGGAGISIRSATDPVLHIPPRHEGKQRTQIRLWSGTPVTSNLLYAGWADEIVSFSLAPYTFI